MKPSDLPKSLLRGGTVPPAPKSPPPLVLAALAQALRPLPARAAASAAADEIAAALCCERVSFGFRTGWRQGRRGAIRVAAMSDADALQSAHGRLALRAAAMGETVAAGAMRVYPALAEGAANAGSGLRAHAMPAHAALHAELRAAVADAPPIHLLSVPVLAGDKVAGAMLLERRSAFNPAEQALAQDLALFAGPVIEIQLQRAHPLAWRLLHAVRPHSRLDARRVGNVTFAGLTVLAVAGLVAAWPSHYRVVAPVRVEGSVHRVIAAPADGFVRSAELRPGQAVRAGQLMATLEDRDSGLEAERWASELAQVDKLYRDALARDDAAQIVMTRARLLQAQAQAELAAREHARTRITAPFDGVLIEGDLSAMVGQPVRRGQALMTVAPPATWRLVIEVDERDVTMLRESQKGKVAFSALNQPPTSFEVVRIAPMAQVHDGRNVFEVEGRIPAGDALLPHLKPGLRGLARIEAERTQVAAVWWQRLRNALQRARWQWLA